MTFIDNLKRWFTMTDEPQRKYNILDLVKAIENGTAEISASYASYAGEGYMSNPDVFACVREISTAVRGIPLVVQKLNSTGEYDTIREHPMLSLLNNPNSYESGSAFREHMVTYHLVGGCAYIMRVGANDIRRPPLHLYLLRPDAVTMLETNTMDNPISGYRYNTVGGAVDIQKELICSLPYFNPLSPNGYMSPIQACATSIDSGNMSRTWNKNLLRNGAKPSGGFNTELSLTDAQFERLQTEFEQKYQGTGNAGRPLLLEAGLKWQAFSLSPAEMDWLNGMKLSTVDICRVFNVPPELIGDATAKTYSNYKEARVALYEETVLPFLDYFCDELNRWLTPLYGDGILLSYDTNAIEALQENTDAVYARLKDAWWLTPNQRRTECGLEADTDPMMDKYYIPQGLIPIEMAGIRMPMPTATTEGDKAFKSLNPLTESEMILSGRVEEALNRVRKDAMKELSSDG